MKTAIAIPEGLTDVLLHACCAPCSSAIVEWMLANGVRPVIFYYNPNIFPREEYEIRKQESKRHAESLGVRWLDGDYDHDGWLGGICGLENEPERGRRCEQCFFFRLKATAEKTQELGIPYFTTTLASSRWKDIEQINRAGRKAEDFLVHSSQCIVHNSDSNHPTLNSQLSTLNCPKFWAQNWRKGGLSDRRNQLLKEFGFYNQQYCGCEFSFRHSATRQSEKTISTPTI